MQNKNKQKMDFESENKGKKYIKFQLQILNILLEYGNYQLILVAVCRIFFLSFKTSCLLSCLFFLSFPSGQNEQEKDMRVSTNSGLIMQEPSENMEDEKRTLSGMIQNQYNSECITEKCIFGGQYQRLCLCLCKRNS